MEKKTVKQQMMEYLIAFGKMYQLPTPSADYLEKIQAALHAEKKKWRLQDFHRVLTILLKDDKYAVSAQFGKYPTINDYFRIKKQIDSAEFYEALSAYLSGCYWEKEHIAAIATPEQRNAITLAGGLENLYTRATGDMPTPIYKLVDIVAENELEAPAELIDTEHRISGPATLKQILNKNQINT